MADRTSPVAIIGLGLMGEVYAERLIATNIPVTGFDIDPVRRTQLAKIGEAGKLADYVVIRAARSRCLFVQAQEPPFG